MRAPWVLLLAAAVSGCATPSAGDDPAATPSSATPPGGSPTPASPSVPSTPATPPAAAIEPLSFIEEELAGTWVRYHTRNRGESNEWGYYQYVAFLEDRTMCEWKHGRESSTDSDDGDYDYAERSPWAVAAERGGGEYLVTAEGSGLEWVFDHSADRVWPLGYETLWRQRATDGKTCDVR